MSVTLEELETTYRDSADPWNFRTSPYEQEKFAATRAALSKDRYASAVELGCGNGALAEHIAPCCDSYVGVDGVERAIEAARQAVPAARFVNCFLPCPLPPGNHDLIILSEILYFMDEGGIGALAEQISHVSQGAEIICVTFLGPTGHVLQGEQALEIFQHAIGPQCTFVNVKRTSGYRIDRHVPQEEHP